MEYLFVNSQIPNWQFPSVIVCIGLAGFQCVVSTTVSWLSQCHQGQTPVTLLRVSNTHCIYVYIMNQLTIVMGDEHVAVPAVEMEKNQQLEHMWRVKARVVSVVIWISEVSVKENVHSCFCECQTEQIRRWTWGGLHWWEWTLLRFYSRCCGTNSTQTHLLWLKTFCLKQPHGGVICGKDPVSQGEMGYKMSIYTTVVKILHHVQPPLRLHTVHTF